MSEILQTHGPAKLRHGPNPLLPSLSQTLPTFLYATARQKTAATLHSQKYFRAPTHNPDRPRSLRNRRASSCDSAPSIWDFPPRRAPDFYDGHARDEARVHRIAAHCRHAWEQSFRKINPHHFDKYHRRTLRRLYSFYRPGFCRSRRE